MAKLNYFIIENPRSYLPHKKEMCFINAPVSINQQRNKAWTTCKIENNSVYLRDDSCLDNYWLVEFMAQTVAVLYKINSDNEEKEFGFLLSIDKLNFISNPKILLGSEIKVKVHLEFNLFPFGLYNTFIYYNNSLICEAKMKFVIDEKGKLLSKMYS